MIVGFSVSDGLIQALATVIAVFVGFILSAYAERRAWTRRKAEQLRDKQLASLVSLSGAVEDFLTASEGLDESELGVSYSNPDSAAVAATKAEAEKRVKTTIATLDAGVRQVRRYVNELRVLNFSTGGLAYADACLAAASRVRAVVGSPSEYTELDESRDALRGAIDDLMASAITGLHD